MIEPEDVCEPIVEPIVEPAAEPIVEPAAESVTEPDSAPDSESAAEPEPLPVAIAAFAADAPATPEDDAERVNAILMAEELAAEPETSAEAAPAAVDLALCFSKVDPIIPARVRRKVVVCVGVGGARDWLENLARCGVRRFILIDADVVSPTNIATQSVFQSEMGRLKVECARDRILDINPEAEVVCVPRFLDNDFTDDEFKALLDRFPGLRPEDYLIAGCTDNFQAQTRSSLLALKYGVPYMAAMMYKDGAAAEVIFVYPGVTESCPRCLLGSRFDKYEHGFVNDVSSAGCVIFATQRMNALKGYVALMLLCHGEDPASPFSGLLERVKNRNFVQIRLHPDVREKLGIGVFDNAFAGASRYAFMDETVWIPQKPDPPSNGYPACRLCGGTGHLESLRMKWADTRFVR